MVMDDCEVLAPDESVWMQSYNSDLSVRSFLCLARYLGHPPTLEEVSGLTALELLAIPNFGKKSLIDVQGWLATNGMTLSEFNPNLAKRLRFYSWCLTKHGYYVQPPDEG